MSSITEKSNINQNSNQESNENQQKEDNNIDTKESNENINNQKNEENKDNNQKINKPLSLLSSKHLSYLISFEQKPDIGSLGFFTSEHIKMSALFWGIGALSLLGALDKRDKEKTVEFILSCESERGGFSGNKDQDPHITFTQYALLILAMINRLDVIDEKRKKKIIEYVKNLQNEDGSFKGDIYTETDSRFSYCAVCILKILGELNDNNINIKKATEYILSCQNFDGGFGSIPGAESHGAYCFCCIGYLSVTGQLNLIDFLKTGKWLAERQTHLGGFNGRPEKLPDVCYSWWVLSSMSMIGAEGFIDRELLIKFILECQDDETGGIGDRPGNCSDIFHTFFGLCGLSLLHYGNLKLIDATYAIPVDDVKRIIK